MDYLRRLYVALTLAVQLVTFTYIVVLLGNRGVIDTRTAIINDTDARIVVYLATFAGLLTLGEAVLFWYEGRIPRRANRRANRRRAEPDDLS